MKQMILLEQFDLKQLLKGKTFDISVGGQLVSLGMERGPKKYSEKQIRCPYCKKGFVNGAGLGSHIHKIHPGRPFKKLLQNGKEKKK